jgi:DNA-binding LacI/PurR family transcriptional regulator
VITDLEAVGVRAAETLIAMVRDRAVPPLVQRVPVRIELGASVAPPRRR